MNRIAIFLAEGFEEIEALAVVDLVRRADLEIHMVSITGSRSIKGSHSITVEADGVFDEYVFDEYDMLVLPGGMPGTKNLFEHEGLKRLILQFHDEGKNLAAICAAPSILGRLGLLQGIHATCYPGWEHYLQDALLTNTSVVREGNIITGKGMGVAIDFSLEIIKMYKDAEHIQQLKESIQFPTH